MVSIGNIIWNIQIKTKVQGFKQLCYIYDEIENILLTKVVRLDNSTELKPGTEQINKVEQRIVEVETLPTNIEKFIKSSNKLYYMRRLFSTEPLLLGDSYEEVSEFLNRVELKELNDAYIKHSELLKLKSECIVLFNEDNIGFVINHPLINLIRYYIKREIEMKVKNNEF